MKILLLSFLLMLQSSSSFYSFKVNGSEGNPIDLSLYKGKKILIVNTASQCGYTSQYAALEELSKKYARQLVVIAFPANNFGGQEPGNDKEIRQFCSTKYNVSFPIAAKVSVKGDDIHPLFQWLVKQENPDFKGDIRWNFEKFLIDENGKLIRRYRSGVKPLDSEITNSL